MVTNVQLLRNSNAYKTVRQYEVRSPLRGSFSLTTGSATRLLRYLLAAPWFGDGATFGQLDDLATVPAFNSVLTLALRCDFAITVDIRVDFGDGTVESILPAELAVPATPPVAFIRSRITTGSFVDVFVTRATANTTVVAFTSELTST